MMFLIPNEFTWNYAPVQPTCYWRGYLNIIMTQILNTTPWEMFGFCKSVGGTQYPNAITST